MVRRRLSNSAKQASMSAYQNFWQQQPQPQSHPQSAPVASVPEYWNLMCDKLGGAVPRLAVMAPPEASKRRVSRVRRQLVKVPREAVTNYVRAQVPLQRGYQDMWDRCCGNQGTLLKPGAILPAFRHPTYSNGAAGASMSPQQLPQRSFQYQQGTNQFSYPAAVPMQWPQQHRQPVPVGILKKTPQLDHPAIPNATKRVTIRSPAVVRRRYQVPLVEQVKVKPEVPPKPSKKTRQQLLKREEHKLLQHQLLCQKELQRQQQIQKGIMQRQDHQKELQRQQQHQKDLQRQQEVLSEFQEQQQHQRELEKVQQQLKQHLQQQQARETHVSQDRTVLELPENCSYFNFGTFASSFLENCTRHLDTDTSNANGNQNFFYQETKTSAESTKPPEKPEVPRKKAKSSGEEKNYSPGLFSLQEEKLNLGYESSTTTLTTEDSPKTPCESRTLLTDKATNTTIDPLGELLKEVPQKITNSSRKLNINQLLRSEKTRGLNADPMWHSLMQLVVQMCESKEQRNQDDPEAKSRLRAGSGADGGPRKKYSVYLMVTSDEEEDEDSCSSRKLKVESTRNAGGERMQGEDEFSKRWGDVYQEEYLRLGRRRRSRKRLDPRLDELAYTFSSSLPFLPMRRPLHWPKQDYSKPSQGRPSRSRTPSRICSRSSTRQVSQVSRQRSLSSVLDPKQSWRLWEDLPMTAKTLNQAYSRILNLSREKPSCTEI